MIISILVMLTVCTSASISPSCGSNEAPSPSATAMIQEQVAIAPELHPDTGIGYKILRWNSTQDQLPAIQVIKERIKNQWGSLPFGDYTFGSVVREADDVAIDVSGGAVAEKIVNFHSEMSYTHKPPTYIAFLCVNPAAMGGDTRIANTRNVSRLLPARILLKLKHLGIQYIRLLSNRVFLEASQDEEKLNPAWYNNWQDFTGGELDYEAARTKLESFGFRVEEIPHFRIPEKRYPPTGDRAMRVEWNLPAFLTHPHETRKGGDESSQYEYLFMSLLDFWDSPYHTQSQEETDPLRQWLALHAKWGDGTDITSAEINSIKNAYDQASRSFALHRGDIIILDNYKWAHGRHPYFDPGTSVAPDRKMLAFLSENLPRDIQTRAWLIEESKKTAAENANFVVSYTEMASGTREDYNRMGEVWARKNNGKAMAGLALNLLRQFDSDSFGKELASPVNLYEHGLQTATRAFHDNATSEMVVAALFHDIGEVFSPGNHGSFASALLRPFVSPSVFWVIDKHEIFQGYYYFHHVGGDRHARDIYKDHPFYQDCVDFCHRWDQNSFDVGFPTMNESDFLPLINEVFSTPAYLYDPTNPKAMASFANL